MDQGKTKFQVGEVIEWNSQSAGQWVTKLGPVLAIVEPNRSIAYILPRLGRADLLGLPKSRVQAADTVASRRYLVEVARPASNGKAARPPIFYAPLVKVIDGTSTGRGNLGSQR